MIVVGCVVLCLFIVWDSYFARHPICPRRFLKNRAFQAAIWISFFDFVSSIFDVVIFAILMRHRQVSFYISNVYLYSFVYVVKPWYV